jgi:hypothetical protein
MGRSFAAECRGPDQANDRARFFFAEIESGGSAAHAIPGQLRRGETLGIRFSVDVMYSLSHARLGIGSSMLWKVLLPEQYWYGPFKVSI